jgi:hypothetical protein
VANAKCMRGMPCVCLRAQRAGRCATAFGRMRLTLFRKHTVYAVARRQCILVGLQGSTSCDGRDFDDHGRSPSEADYCRRCCETESNRLHFDSVATLRSRCRPGVTCCCCCVDAVGFKVQYTAFRVPSSKLRELVGTKGWCMELVKSLPTYDLGHRLMCLGFFSCCTKPPALEH